jgi:SAM-dependent methyltransferase
VRRSARRLVDGDAGAAYSRRVGLPDFVPSPNQLNLKLYEIENRALDRQGLVLDAMRKLAPWAGRTLVDLGCGSGFWLPRYTDGAEVIGVEPDERLIPTARRRVHGVDVLLGSAEHVPLGDSSVDVVHARFAYFFPPGCEAGFDEVMRVLRPGGTLVVVDNDLRHGEFAALVVGSAWAQPQGQASTTDAWWQARDATRTAIMSDWRFDSRQDMEAVLRMELPPDIVDPWLLRHPDRCHISYGYVLFSTMKADR